MISYPDQDQDRLDIPAVPDDIKWLGDNITSLSHWMKKVYDALRRQESPNPTMIRLNPGVTLRTSTRYRCMALVFSGGTASETIALLSGRGSVFDWIVPSSPGVVVLPFMGILENGQDYVVQSITTPAAVNWTAWLVAYVELEDGGE